MSSIDTKNSLQQVIAHPSQGVQSAELSQGLGSFQDLFSIFEAQVTTVEKPKPSRPSVQAEKKAPARKLENNERESAEQSSKPLERKETESPKQSSRNSDTKSQAREMKESEPTEKNESSRNPKPTEEKTTVENREKKNVEKKEGDTESVEELEVSGQELEVSGQEDDQLDSAEKVALSGISPEDSTIEEVSLDEDSTIEEVSLDGDNIAVELEKTSNDESDSTQEIELELEASNVESESDEELQTQDSSQGLQIENYMEEDSLKESPDLRDQVNRVLDLAEQMVRAGDEEYEGISKEEILAGLQQLREYVSKPGIEKVQKLDMQNLQKVLPVINEMIAKATQNLQPIQNMELQGGSIELPSDFEMVEPQKLVKETSSSAGENSSEEIKVEEVEVELQLEEKQSKNDKKSVQLEPKTAEPVPQSHQDKLKMALGRAANHLENRFKEESQMRNAQQSAQEATVNKQQEGASSGQYKGQKESSQENNLFQIFQRTRQDKPVIGSSEAGKSFLDVVRKLQSAEAAKGMESASFQAKDKKAVVHQMVRKPAFRGSSRVILQQIMDKMKMVKGPQVKVIRMILRPEHLGELKLEVSKLQEGLKVKLQAQTHLVKETLDQNLPQIRDALKQNGLEVERIEVELKEQREEDQSNQEQGAQENQKKGSRKSSSKSFSLDMEDEGALQAEEESLASKVDNSYLVNQYV